MTRLITRAFAAHCCFIWGHSKHTWGENKVVTVILDPDGDCALSNTESFTVPRSLAVSNDDLRRLKIGNQRLRSGSRGAIQNHIVDAIERRSVPGAKIVRRIALTRGVSGASPCCFHHGVMCPEKMATRYDGDDHQEKKCRADRKFYCGDA